MKRLSYVVLSILLIILITSKPFIIHTTSTAGQSQKQVSSMPNKELLKKFLEKQYIPEIGLLRSATKAYPDNITIYVAKDNVLAARALAVLGSSLASKVLAILNNNFSGGFNGRIDVLIGKKDL